MDYSSTTHLKLQFKGEFCVLFGSPNANKSTQNIAKLQGSCGVQKACRVDHRESIHWQDKTCNRGNKIYTKKTSSLTSARQ